MYYNGCSKSSNDILIASRQSLTDLITVFTLPTDRKIHELKIQYVVEFQVELALQFFVSFLSDFQAEWYKLLILRVSTKRN